MRGGRSDAQPYVSIMAVLVAMLAFTLFLYLNYDEIFKEKTPQMENPHKSGTQADGGSLTSTDTEAKSEEKGLQKVCGNGVREDEEECDKDDLGGMNCKAIGFDDGVLGCYWNCTFNTSGCYRYVCGNGVTEPGEVCDGEDLGNETCKTFGFLYGSLSCLTDCSGFDVSGCTNTSSGSLCGNGIIDEGEECDGANVGNKTCQSIGYLYGILVCLPNCQGYDASGCSNKV